MKRKKIPYGTKLPVKPTFRERDLICNHTFYDPDFANHAVTDSKGIQIELSLGDIEDIQGYVAAEANHCDDEKFQNGLDRLFEKLQVLLDSYHDQEE